MLRKFVQASVVAGAPNTATTLTIPAPGSNGHIFITYLLIARVATAALAGGAILTVTTTNWQNAGTQWRFGNLISAGQRIVDLDAYFDPPMESPSAITAVTIIAPAAGIGVSWDMIAHWYTES